MLSALARFRVKADNDLQSTSADPHLPDSPSSFNLVSEVIPIMQNEAEHLSVVKQVLTNHRTTLQVISEQPEQVLKHIQIREQALQPPPVVAHVPTPPLAIQPGAP